MEYIQACNYVQECALSCMTFIEFVAFFKNRYSDEPLWRDAFVLRGSTVYGTIYSLYRCKFIQISNVYGITFSVNRCKLIRIYWIIFYSEEEFDWLKNYTEQRFPYSIFF